MSFTLFFLWVYLIFIEETKMKVPNKHFPIFLTLSFLFPPPYTGAMEVDRLSNHGYSKNIKLPHSLARSTKPAEESKIHIIEKEPPAYPSVPSHIFKVHGTVNEQLNTILAQTQMTSFDASSSIITDEELLKITQHLPKLHQINVSNSPITNYGLKNLSMLCEIENLDLSGTIVNSDGLEAVLGLENLKEINLSYLILSKEFLNRLFLKRPALKVIYDKQNVF